MLKAILKLLLGGFLLFMMGFNFNRNYYLPLDGDLPSIVLPAGSYTTVMGDPFGLNVLLHDSVYAAPNRFFTHLIVTAYFRSVPIWIQQWVSPIDSVYITAAIARTFTQFFLIFLIAMYATGKKKWWHLDFLFVAALCTPLFQTYGFYTWMGVLDQAVTYMFFYAFSIALVMLYFLPFFNAGIGREKFKPGPLLLTGLIGLCIVNSFSGPLNAPVSILICTAVFLNLMWTSFRHFQGLSLTEKLTEGLRQISPAYTGMLLFTMLLSLYSYYIGRNNIENQWISIPLSERYYRLGPAFWYHYTFKLAQPLLIGMVALNSVIIYFSKPDEESSRVLKIIRWFAVFSLLYIALLPLGGYRAYRSEIIRYDMIMPVTLGLMIFYGYTSVYIFKKLKTKYKITLYTLLLSGISAIYIQADWGIRIKNSCERSAFEELSASTEKVVLLKQDCQVMNWGKMEYPEQSKTKADMLLYWNIIKEPKLYYQQEVR